MHSPEYLYHVSDQIVDLYEELNSFAIQDICRRLVSTDFRLSGSIEWQYHMMQEAGLSRQEINKEIARITGKSEKEVKEVFEDSCYQAYKADMSVYKQAGVQALSFAQSPAMLSILQGTYEQTNGTLYNLTQTTANASQKLLIDTMSKIQFRVMSGQQSHAQAIRQAVNEIASSGVKVEYKGAERNLESVVRMAVVTGVNQAGIKQTLYNANQIGYDLVLTTAHMGARIGEGYKGHINWQGRVCSVSGAPHPEEEKRIGMPILGLVADTGYGLVDGLGGANCRHSLQLWTEGYSGNPYYDKDGKPLYDTEESNELYKKQQKQRSMERGIRDSKRKLQALQTSINSCAETDVRDMLQKDYDKAALKLKQRQDNYKLYCADNGLQTQYERMQIANWSHKEASKAMSAARREMNSVRNTVGAF